MRLNPQLKQLRPGYGADRGYRGRGGKRERFRRTHKHHSTAQTFEDSRRTPHAAQDNPLRPHRISRPEMVRTLDKAGLLPAICFIFSRAGCDGAVTQCIDADLMLTTDEQQRTIRAYIAEATAHLDTRDLNTLGYYEWREGLLRGIAAHHAGMLPLFKETVETLFTTGLIKLVFATETLALGINMPARTVILEKLTKYNGETHVDITPGEYTQLTGRAGRRGIDIEGHAVIAWRPNTTAAHVASLASTRTYPLNSSFRPTYNMAANLIATYGAERTRKILESSFAQFQADKSVVGVAARVRKNENALAGYHESMRCHLGDFAEYFALRRDISALEKKAEKTNQRHARTQAHQSIQELLPGDIIHIPTGRLRGYAVVTTRAESNTDPRIGILTEDAHTRTATPRDFEGIIDPVSRIKLPKRLTLKTPKERRDTASRMRQALIDHKPPRETKHRTITERPNGLQEQLETLRTKMRNHPCHGCSERETHARWAERWYKLNSDTDGLRRQIARRTNTIAHVFNRIAQLLTSYGYVNRATDGELTLTSTGQSLRRIYGDKDLLTCLCLEAGFLNTLDPAAIAATIAALTYQGKRDTIEHLPRYPHPSLRESITTINRELARLNASEEEHKLPQTPACDFGLVEPIYAWARGAHLAKALENTDLTAGDFVRWAKQVIDSLDQITHINGINADLRARCEKAIILIRRGVIALDI
jgi:putative ATP-dependent RNA helicase